MITKCPKCQGAWERTTAFSPCDLDWWEPSINDWIGHSTCDDCLNPEGMETQLEKVSTTRFERWVLLL